MSEFFINRPNFAWVVAIFILLAGMLAIPSLPVEKYPQVAPPQVRITATYPGASASVLNDSVTSLIEEELNGANGLLYYESSSSSNGFAEIVVTFRPGTNPNLAQVDVQNRIKKAEARLPQAVKQQGLEVEQANDGFLMLYGLRYKGNGEGKDPQRLADYAARNINNEIRRLPGVGKIQFFAFESAMRVWVDLQKLLSYDLSMEDVNRVIAAQNVQVPAGSFGDRPSPSEQELTATLVVKGMLTSPEEFGRIVLRANPDGSAVRLAHVARLEFGSQNYGFDSRLNGQPAALAAVQLSPGANALGTVTAVKNRLKELSAAFPDDMEFSIPYDTSKFVKVAIEKVVHTLIEAIVLVFLVMFLFLQNFRYTLIPTIVVPVCLMGTFAVMSVLGFSVNMMTMFGMVLAIGILVDDAIVVVENVERTMAEEGLSPRDATLKAMTQITGAIVGITLVLSAVFLPLAFMGGSVGVIYRQFSMSVAISILISGFLALTMTPALCATLLKPIAKGHSAEKKGFFGWFNRRFSQVTDGYGNVTSRLVGKAGRVMVIYAAMVAVLGFTYLRLPEAFVPSEDLGTFMVNMQLPPGATHGRTIAVAEEMEQYFQSRPANENISTVLGYSFSGMGQNAAMAFPELKDWSVRGKGESVMDEVAAANRHFAGNKDGTLFALNLPPVDGLGNSGGFSLRLQDRGGLGRKALSDARNQVLEQADASPVISYVMVEGLSDAPQLRLEVDRQKAEALGVDFSSINTVISSAFGSSLINEFVNAGRVQRVIVQADGASRVNPGSLDHLYVPNVSGNQVPLKAFTTTAWETGPVQVARYNGFPAFKIAGDAATGHSTGEAMAEMERIMDGLPTGIGYEWTGLSYQEKLAGAQAPKLFALALIVVFLLLVALYESWSIPLSVMMIVPIGALGSVLAVMVMDMSNDVYFKVGLITIIGLGAKNAILIAEFAKELYDKGHSLSEAAVKSARVRFRPIVMTSMAFILGVIPLAVATGAGGASQRAIGTGVIGGMLSATLLGVLFIPVFFVWVLKIFKGRRKQSSAPSHPVNLEPKGIS
jgi:multidrug efflux pump